MRRRLPLLGSSAGLCALLVFVAVMTGIASQVVQSSGDETSSGSPSQPEPTSTVVSNEVELQLAVRELTPGATILIAPGTYRLTSTLQIDGNLADVTLKGSTGRPTDVVLEGAGLSVESSAPTAIRVTGDVQRLQIADLTIRRFSEHAILLEAGPRAARLSNLRLFDAGHALLRVSAGASTADDGVIEDSVLGYTSGAEGAFAGGIDLQGVRAWTVRGNTFRNIRTLSGDFARPAVAASAGSSETLVQQNQFVNCQLGVAFGLIDLDGGFDHSGGRITDNFVYRSPAVHGGPGILVADSPDTTIAHNTVVMSATYPSPIEYRYADAANLTVANNLVDGAISALDGAWALGGGNVVDASPELFVSATVGDLHLRPTALLAIDAGDSGLSDLRDIDGDRRMADGAPDAGADEIDRANAYPVVELMAGDPLQADDGIVTVEATASDSDGDIAAVEFYVEAMLVASVDRAPYVADVRMTGSGSRSVMAIAVDNGGGRTASAILVSDVTFGTDKAARAGSAGTLGAAAVVAGERAEGVGELAAAAALVGGTYLSDMTWTSMTNGWGPVEKDRSNGEQASGDGRTLTLNGVTYAKGLGGHAASDVRYNLNRGCSAFSAVIGVDDEPNSGGNIVFQVYLDNVKRFDSGVMNGTMPGRAVDLSLTGASVSRLVITDGGNGKTADHGDWADAQVVCGGGSVPTSPEVSTTSPAAGATAVARNSNVTATFSTAMAVSSLTTSTVTLVRQGSGTPVAAAVSYAAATRIVTLDPSVDLDPSILYTATIKGSAGGVTDAAGTPLAASRIWTFTTAAATVPPPTGNVILPGENIQARVAAAPAGTAFILKAGVHRLQSISPKDGNSFTGEAGTVLSGARLLTAFTRSGTYWVASGQTQEGAIVGSCRPGFTRCNRPEELFIDDQRLQHVSTLSAVGPGKWYFDYPGDRIYFADDPTGRKVETSVTTQAFQAQANNVTITRLVVEKYANPAQAGAMTSAGKSGWVITGNEVRLNHGSGIGIGHSAQVRQNNVHHNGQIGITGVGDNAVVEGNEIAYNNAAKYDSWWEAGGTKFALTRNLVVRGNFIHHNDGPGLWTDIDNIDTIHEGNTVEDNVGPGIFHEISYKAIIRNNIVRRNGFRGEYEVWAWGAGILISASRDVEVYGNTVEDNGDGIMAIQQDRGAGAFGSWQVVNLWVHDNTIVRSAGWSGGLAIDLDSYDASYFTSLNNRWNNNRYTMGPAALPFEWRDDEISRAQWQAAGQDVSSVFDR